MRKNTENRSAYIILKRAENVRKNTVVWIDC